MDTSTPAQNRRSRRSNVLLSASIQVGSEELSVKLRNLSADGALVEGHELPPRGSEVVFRRNELCECGRIVWAEGNHAGIAFDAKLDRDQVLRNVPKPRPKAPVDFRRPGLACRELTGEERRLVESWLRGSSLSRPGE